MWHIIIAVAILVLAACGENSDINPITPARSNTFTVSGSVFDTVARPVDQATIEALDGPHAGAVTLSDANGRFSFGVRRFTEQVTFQASKEGYHSAQQRVGSINGFPDVNRSFQLASLTPSIDLTGGYLVTLTADAACTSLPANATSRTYSATVTRGFSDTYYIGRLSGATFVPAPVAFWRYDSFFANVSGTFARFGFSNPDDYGIVEQLASDAFVEFSGTSDAVEAGTSSVEVPLSGSFRYCAAPRPNFFECTIPVITCTSTNHRLTLTRTGLP
jgi:Carboxypeptidase regulatory-like domain